MLVLRKATQKTALFVVIETVQVEGSEQHFIVKRVQQNQDFMRDFVLKFIIT